MERQRDEDEERRSSAKSATIDPAMKAAKERLFALVRNRKLEELQTLLNSMDAKNGERTELINSVNSEGWTILHVATFNYDISTIKWILSDSGGRAAGFNNVLAKTNEGRTALHFAVQRRRFDAFSAIVEGCKVENGERTEMLNAVDKDGKTLLHQAARSRSEDIVKWLLSEKAREAGFNPNNLFAMTSENGSILHCAESGLSVECLDLIISQCRNTEERCRLLFGVDNWGRTVLHDAALSERLPIVEWAVSRLHEERGGSNEDLFALNNNKESALHLAALAGSIEVFDFLLSRCNNTSERLRLFLGRDDKGWTIFYHAAWLCKADLISHILHKYPEESKMIINARDERGMTVLHRAIIGGIDKESRKEWSDWHSEEDKQAVVSSLLGLSYVEDEERGHPEKDAAAMSNDDEGKKPIEEKKVVIIAAGGADPNVGLKFE